MNKLDEVASLLVCHEPDLFFVVESWTNDNVSNAEIQFSGYDLVLRNDRKDTSNGRGGGILIYGKKSIIITNTTYVAPYDQCGVIQVENLKIALTYRSPNAKCDDEENIKNFIQAFKENSVIIGDFNYSTIDWETLTS